MDVKIAVAYHKEGFIVNHPYLIPVQAGKAISKKNLHIQGDDEGDNISWKNLWYCELTVLYWLWKNTKADYKGLIHYRRSFTVKKAFWLYKTFLRIKYTARRFSSIWSPYSSLGVKKQYGCRSIEQYQKDVDIFTNKIDVLLAKGINVIAPHPGRFFLSIRRTLCWEVGGTSIDVMDKIVKENYPDFFPHYDRAMNGTLFYNCNMSVMDNNTFNEYCTILFGILEKHEEEMVKQGFLMNVSKEKSYARVSGYLGEMITNAYIQYCLSTNKKVKILPVSFLKG